MQGRPFIRWRAGKRVTPVLTGAQVWGVYELTAWNRGAGLPLW